jgi:hypothetical protein
MTRSVAWICAVVAILAGSPHAVNTQNDAAQAAAESWLKIVDAGNYESSWDEAANGFKAAVTKEQWSQAVAVARGPLGSLVSRKLRSREYTDRLPGAPAGKFVVIRFETAFEKNTQAVETIVSMLDADDTWRVAGYTIQ